MLVRPEQVKRLRMLVSDNAAAEAVRKDDSLCLHCASASTRPGTQEDCEIAQQIYKLCATYGTALGLSRYAVWKEEPGETYLPIAKSGETYPPIALATKHLDMQAAPRNAGSLSRPILITRLLAPQSDPQVRIRIQ